MLRTIRRHPTATVAVVSIGLAIVLNQYYETSHLVMKLAHSGAFLGLFATLAGFLITGLTIMLTLSNHPALEPVAETRAYAYIHRSFMAAIWTQILALVLSVIVQGAQMIDRIHCFLEYSLLLSVFVAAGMLGTSIWFLSLVVNKVLESKKGTWDKG